MYISCVYICFNVRNMIYPRTDRHFYVSLVYIILTLINIYITMRKNKWLMHISFFFMIVSLPLRLVNFENIKEAIGDYKWTIQLIVYSLGAIWNISQYSRFLPLHPLSILMMFVSLFYTAFCVNIGVLGKLDM